MPTNTIEELELALEKAKAGGWLDRENLSDAFWKHGDEILALAKLGLLVREGGEEVEKVVVQAIIKDARTMGGGYRPSIDAVAVSPTVAARAVLRTLQGMIK